MQEKNHYIKIDDKSFERVKQFQYLGKTKTNQNFIYEDIKSRLMSQNACYCSVQNLWSSSLLSKNTKIKIHRTVILPIVLYKCEAWPLALTEEHRLRVFKNRMLKKMFGLMRDEIAGEWRRLHIKELYDLFSLTNIIRMIKSRRMRWTCQVVHMKNRTGAPRVLVG